MKNYFVANKNLRIFLGLLILTLVVVNLSSLFGQDIFLAYIKLFLVGLMFLSLFFFRIKSTINPSKKDKIHTLLFFLLLFLIVISSFAKDLDLYLF